MGPGNKAYVIHGGDQMSPATGACTMMVLMSFLSIGAGRRALSRCQGQGGDVIMDESGHYYAMYTAVLCCAVVGCAVPPGLKDPMDPWHAREAGLRQRQEEA